MKLTEEQKQFYYEALKDNLHKTQAKLCQELGVNLNRLVFILKAVGLVKPPAPRNPYPVEVPREALEALIQAGKTRYQIEAALGLCAHSVRRLLRVYQLNLPTTTEAMRQREAQGLRRCPQCKQTKPLATDFGDCRTGRLGKNMRCRACLKAYSLAFRQKNRDRINFTRANPPPPETRDWRLCLHCHQRKRLSTEFDPDPSEPRGRAVYCRDCLPGIRQRALERQAKQELAAQGLRRCSRCLEVKRLEHDFANDRRAPFGKALKCLACARAGKSTAHEPAFPAPNAPAPLPAPLPCPSQLVPINLALPAVERPAAALTG